MELSLQRRGLGLYNKREEPPALKPALKGGWRVQASEYVCSIVMVGLATTRQRGVVPHAGVVYAVPRPP